MIESGIMYPIFSDPIVFLPKPYRMSQLLTALAKPAA